MLCADCEWGSIPIQPVIKLSLVPLAVLMLEGAW